ncbi:sugar phosphate isomerase/epimerase [Shimia sp. R11_0]|uniref:sugar phosphate isomerase/epimerase family protein n=1 Tax=Shimia sp. R11_0 TaxID=2821096 RepID=UPI001ADA9010|nr:sugar phosphate isomerase/epimerase family protein [Shimia sp. R11_0]MBO9479148.1 sugar phosphate isomerase/epimerase [Shimia sp. R11_0]
MRDFTHDHSALALNTATLGHNLDGFGAGWSPEQVIDACAERGYGGITFWRRELAGRAADIGARTRAAGLQVVGLCRTPFLTGSLALPDDRAIMTDFYRSIDEAAALETGVLTIVTGGPEPGTKGVIESQKILADRVARAADYAAERNVKLALEPLNPATAGNRTCIMTAADALNVCDAVGAANVGIAIDVYHVWWDTTLAETLSQRAKGRILGYHLCDWLADTADVLLDRGMMGDGVADLKALRAAVESAGYTGLCEVEIFSANNWWQHAPEEVLDTIVERFRSYC